MAGYKTYLACIAGIVWAAYGLYSGQLDAASASHLIETALVGAGLRNAIAAQ